MGNMPIWNTAVKLTEEHNDLLKQIERKSHREFRKGMLIKYIREVNFNTNIVNKSIPGGRLHTEHKSKLKESIDDLKMQEKYLKRDSLNLVPDDSY